MSRRRLGAEIAFLMQFSVPADRAERSPKGVGSIPVVRAAARRERPASPARSGAAGEGLRES